MAFSVIANQSLLLKVLRKCFNLLYITTFLIISTLSPPGGIISLSLKFRLIRSQRHVDLVNFDLVPHACMRFDLLTLQQLQTFCLRRQIRVCTRNF